MRYLQFLAKQNVCFSISFESYKAPIHTHTQKDSSCLCDSLYHLMHTFLASKTPMPACVYLRSNRISIYMYFERWMEFVHSSGIRSSKTIINNRFAKFGLLYWSDDPKYCLFGLVGDLRKKWWVCGYC